MSGWSRWGALALLLVCLGGGGWGQETSAPAPETAAQAADLSWLGLVDAGRYGESWSAAASSLRGAISAEAFAKALASAREPLGAMQSRRMVSATRATTLPGAPDGEYVVAEFDSSFAKKAHARERVTATREEDGSWRVSGYYIK